MCYTRRGCNITSFTWLLCNRCLVLFILLMIIIPVRLRAISLESPQVVKVSKSAFQAERVGAVPTGGILWAISTSVSTLHCPCR